MAGSLNGREAPKVEGDQGPEETPHYPVLASPTESTTRDYVPGHEPEEGTRASQLESSNSMRAYFVRIIPLTASIPDEHLPVVTRQYAIKGLLFMIVGIIAIVFPFVFGLAIEQLLAWVLVLGGGVTLVQFCMLYETRGSTSFLLLGALHFMVGIWLLLKPIQGLTALTFILSGWFLCHGILKLVMAWQMGHIGSWPAVLVSGLLSIVLGFMIVWLTPTYGLKLVGIIFGADLTATGASVLVLSLIAYLSRSRQSDVESGRAETREPLLA